MHVLTHSLILTLGLLTTACATSGSLSSAPAKVDGLLGSIAEVEAETERSRTSVAEAYDQLVKLTATDTGDRTVAEAYTDFVRRIEEVAARTEALRQSTAMMQDSAAPVFARWTDGLARIAHERLRQRSEDRLAKTRSRFDAITLAAARSQQQFDAFVQRLRDHATFLAYDLNEEALQTLHDEMQPFAAEQQALDQEFETCLTATRTYVAHASLPAAPQ